MVSTTAAGETPGVAPPPPPPPVVVTCPGKRIRGNKKDNKLRGTCGPDKIIAKGGDDVLRGKAGNDVLRCGEGREDGRGDRAFGGPGKDRFIGCEKKKQ